LFFDPEELEASELAVEDLFSVDDFESFGGSVLDSPFDSGPPVFDSPPLSADLWEVDIPLPRESVA